MKTLLFPTFSINISKCKTKKSNINRKDIISRTCLATVIVDDGELKACIQPNEYDTITDKVVLPFTKESFNLKDKTHVYSTKKDKNGRNILYIRDAYNSAYHYGTPEQYKVLKENCVVAGKIIKIQGKMYFDYEEFVAFNNFCPHINYIKIDDTKPIFK